MSVFGRKKPKPPLASEQEAVGQEKRRVLLYCCNCKQLFAPEPVPFPGGPLEFIIAWKREMQGQTKCPHCGKHQDVPSEAWPHLCG